MKNSTIAIQDFEDIRKLDEIELVLDKPILFGWENPYSFLKVQAVKKAREIGQILPAIDVVKKEDSYQLLFGPARDYKNYGGHSRAIVAFQRGEPIRCNVFDRHRLDVPETMLIGDFPIVSVPFQWLDIRTLQPERKISRDSLYGVKKCLDHLPADVVKSFLEENDLILRGEGKNAYLLDGEQYRNLPSF